MIFFLVKKLEIQSRTKEIFCFDKKSFSILFEKILAYYSPRFLTDNKEWHLQGVGHFSTTVVLTTFVVPILKIYTVYFAYIQQIKFYRNFGKYSKIKTILNEILDRTEAFVLIQIFRIFFEFMNHLVKLSWIRH